MPRAIWSGTVSFGLVNVPVKLYSAVSEKGVKFHQIDRRSEARVRQKRVSEETGREVEYDDIVKGYEISKGRYVTLTDEDMQALEPESTRTIDLEAFVDLDAIDPIYFDRTYYLEPDSGSDKAYRLLVDALGKANKVGIGRFVMRTKQYLAALRPIGDVLGVETMHFPDEIVDTDELDLPRKTEVSDRELAAADQLIDSLTADWEPDQYHDTYREEMLALIERKAEGKEIVAPAAEAEDRAPVLDLMAALEASLEKKGRGGRKKSSKAKDGDDLTSLTKDELLKRAADADIEGRSKMSKDELVAALGEAEGSEARSA